MKGVTTMTDQIRFHYVAEVECLIGIRNLNKIMSSAGLGISAVGRPYTIKLTFKEGETVDGERVLEVVRKTVDKMEQEGSEIELTSPKVVSIQGVVIEDDEEDKDINP